MKFEAGEIAVLVRPFIGIGGPDLRAGQEVEVLVVGPLQAGQQGEWRGHPFTMGVDADYIIGEYPAWHCAVRESELRKRRPPIPDSILSVFTTHKTGEPVDV